MNLIVKIEYLTNKDEAVVEYYREKDNFWIFTERISLLVDTLPFSVQQILQRYGNKAALHSLGLVRAKIKAKYFKGTLTSYEELN